MTPEPTPDVGTSKGENGLPAEPCEVIVTTDARAVATMSVSESRLGRLGGAGGGRYGCRRDGLNRLD